MEFQIEYPHFCEQSKFEFSLSEMSPPVQARGSESLLIIYRLQAKSRISIDYC